MGKDIEIERKVEWLSQERKWEASVVIRLRADEHGNLAKIFRNKNKELAGEKLTYVWGDYNSDGVVGWREKRVYEVFDRLLDAKAYTMQKRDEFIEELRIVTRENKEMMIREFDEIEEYEVNEETGDIVMCE